MSDESNQTGSTGGANDGAAAVASVPGAAGGGSGGAAGGAGGAAAADADAFLASLGVGGAAGAGGGEGGKKNKKKKKGKKKPGKAADEEAKPEAEGKKPKSAVAKLAQQRMEQLKQEEEERKRREEEERRKEEEERKAAEEAERLREEKLEKRRKAREEKRERLKREGRYLTAAQRKKQQQAQMRLQLAGAVLPAARDESGGSSPASAEQDGAKAGKATVAKPTSAAGKRKKKKNLNKFDTGREETPEPVAEPAAAAEAEAEPAQAAAAAGSTTKGEEEAAPAPAAVSDVAVGVASDDDWEAEAEAEAASPAAAAAMLADEEEEEDDWEAVAEKVEEAEAEERRKREAAEKARRKEEEEAACRAAQAEAAKAEGDGSDWEDEAESDGEEHDEAMEKRIAESRRRREARQKESLANRSADKLRSPVLAVLGHVDTGKTKLLDKIRRSNVQEGEAGGITQQIGATFFPADNLRKLTSRLNKKRKVDIRIPGLLVIDTPGHESFTNLRNRGSSMCDIAILVIDIMHGLEPQTLESIKLLQKHKTPFVVALNKVDRCYGWKECINTPIEAALAKQEDFTVREFEERAQKVITELMEQGLNAELYYKNTNPKEFISLVPTSAHSGEGVQDLMLLMIDSMQEQMLKRIMWQSEPKCTLLEVKAIDGLGTTIDVVLLSGHLRVGDTIVCCGINGPIVTTVRALLTPKPMKELRVKGSYVHHEVIEGAMGIKIAAHGVEHALAGTSVLVKHADDEIEDLKAAAMTALRGLESLLQKSGRGVHVQASTLGSLEALLEFLRTLDPPIPVAGFSVGPVHRRDVMQASIMLEHQEEYATILAFDVPVSAEAEAEARKMGVTIFTAEIIYHLFDRFCEHLEAVKQRRREESSGEAVFPCELSIYKDHVFAKRNPILLGVKIQAGILKKNTPLAVVRISTEKREVLEIGRVTGIEHNHEQKDYAKAGDDVAVRIASSGRNIEYGRHFDHRHILYSKLTRRSIDLLKANFKDDLEDDDWRLVIRLKKVFGIL